MGEVPPPLPEPIASFEVRPGGEVRELRYCPACESPVVLDPRTGRLECGGPTRCRRVRDPA